jgi:hypothetical protein
MSCCGSTNYWIVRIRVCELFFELVWWDWREGFSCWWYGLEGYIWLGDFLFDLSRLHVVQDAPAVEIPTPNGTDGIFMSSGKIVITVWILRDGDVQRGSVVTELAKFKPLNATKARAERSQPCGKHIFLVQRSSHFAF